MITLLLGAGAAGQTLPFREYTMDDGLPQSETIGAMQDSRGYLWIPTRNGLARSDGHSLTTYLRKDGLPSNVVPRLAEDRAGVLWAFTPNGPARFDGKKFHGYPAPDSLSIKQISLACISITPGTFFLMAKMKEDQPKIIYFEAGHYHDFAEMHPVLKGRQLTALACDVRDSSLYLSDSDSSLYKFRNDVLTFIDRGPVMSVTITDSTVILNDGDRTLSYDGKTVRPCNNTPDPKNPLSIQNLYDDPDSLLKILIPGIQGVKWDKGRIIYHIIDREGVLWLLTESKIYRLLTDAFTEYGKESGLPEAAWGMAADHAGGLWLGSITGELKYFDGNRFTNQLPGVKLYGQNPVYYRGSTTLSNGEVWLSTNRGVIIRDEEKFRTLDLIPGPLQVCIVYEDPVDKTVFVGTDQGLYHISGDKVVLHHEMSWTDLGIAEGIARDDRGNFWIGGHYGVVFFDGQQFVPFRSAPAPAEMVWGVIKDYRGNIWSAGSDGLFICDPDDPGFRPAMPAARNLPASVIRDMGDRRLLVGRMLDICIIDLEKYYAGQIDYFTIIGRNRGFTGNDCQDNGITRDAMGRWWLLTSDKLIRFDPDKLKMNPVPPLTHITEIESLTDSLIWIPVLDTALYYDTDNRVTMRGNKNGLRISYTGISMKNPEEVTFQYRLSGLDEKWSPKTVERSVSFYDLTPGHYTFELQSYNGDGIKSPVPETLSITVVPTLFQTLAVKIILLMAAVALVVFLTFQTRRRIVENRVRAAQVQAESYRLQLNSVIKQFDPHFTFNAVTSVGALIMKGEKEKAYNYFIKLSNLLRSVLTDSSVLLKTLSDEIDFVTRYCELQKLRFGDRFNFEIKTDPDVDLSTQVPKMIIQSFVENAMKHGLENKQGEGRVNIYISRLKNGLGILVRDNGIGRKASSELQTGGGGLGLKNISSLINTLNRGNSEKITFTITDLYDDNKPSGTEVRIFLPQPYIFDLSLT